MTYELADNSLRNRRVMLVSNSVCHGQGYLEHCIDDIVTFLGPEMRRVLFLPYAAVAKEEGQDDAWDHYAKWPRRVFGEYGIQVESAHRLGDRAALDDAQAIFIGGGNTFHLLYWLYHLDMLDGLRHLIENGVPVIGSSAGTNVLCPTIMTTNDMPSILPPSLDAIRAVNFQINPHYFDSDPNSLHQGETREQRIQEFQILNPVPVLGLREGAWLRVKQGNITLCGKTGAKLFLPDRDPRECQAGEDLSHLIPIS